MDSYERQLHELEARHRPRPRTVLSNLVKTPRRGLIDAARRADEHADALAAIFTPEAVREPHDEYISALRAVASNSRELAKGTRLRTGQQSIRKLRALPSFQRMVAARAALLRSRRT